MPADQKKPTMTPKAALALANKRVGPLVKIAPGRRGWGYAARDGLYAPWYVNGDELLARADAEAKRENWLLGIAVIEILTTVHGVDPVDAGDAFDILDEEADCLFGSDEERVAKAVEIFMFAENVLAEEDARTYREKGGLPQ